jgi:GAF domain-containing protein/anti-sigma regulatory factor (Ser/Thr protein kinase)
VTGVKPPAANLARTLREQRTTSRERHREAPYDRERTDSGAPGTRPVYDSGPMARPELSAPELLERLQRLAVVLGTDESPDVLAQRMLGEVADTFGAVAASVVLTLGAGESSAADRAGRRPPAGGLDWLAVDLVVGARVVGVVELGFDGPRRLTSAEASSLRTAARLVAHAVDRAQLAEARDRLAFLAEVSNAVSSSLELRELLERVCAVGVPRLGDWSTILLPEGVALERCAGAHADPAKQHLVDRLVGRFAVPMSGSSPIAQAFRTGETVVVPAVEPAVVAGIVDDREYIDIVLELSRGGAMMVPLLARGRPIGVIAYGLEDAGRVVADDDVWLACEAAKRAAIGIDNASRYEQEHLVAELLQRAVLPEEVPTPAGVDLAARYVPAGPGVEVGGDWYDAFVLDDGRVGLVIGDVAGHDVAAASSMAQLRNALRAYAFDRSSPAAVLSRLNKLLCRSSDPLFASAIFGVLSADRCRFTWANAGHPPAVLVRDDGVATTLDRPRGLVLGVRDDVEYPEGEIAVGVHDVLVLYTDGLVERRGESLQVGIARLAALAERIVARGPSADAVAERLLESLLARHARTDDVCLLAAWLMAVPSATVGSVVELDLAPDPASSRLARQQVVATLDAWGASELADPVELLVSELVTNAVSHVGAGVRLRVERLPAGVRVRVYDDGEAALPTPLREVPPDVPTGRGLLIVDNLADRWRVEATESGKQVWFELSFDGAARRWARVAHDS